MAETQKGAKILENMTRGLVESGMPAKQAQEIAKVAAIRSDTRAAGDGRGPQYPGTRRTPEQRNR